MRSGAEQFVDWMKRRGMNQAETAEFFGWDQTFISALVNNRRQPGLRNAIQIERATGIAVEAWLSSEHDNSDDAVPAKSEKPNRTR